MLYRKCIENYFLYYVKIMENNQNNIKCDMCNTFDSKKNGTSFTIT